VAVPSHNEFFCNVAWVMIGVFATEYLYDLVRYYRSRR
jgi:hypothetical protein